MNSIRARLTFAIVALILLSVSIMGSVSYWNAKNTIIREMENSLTLLSRDNAEKLGMWVAERKSEVAFLANSPLVGQIAFADNPDGPGHMTTSKQYDFLNRLIKHPVIVRF